ncbi:3'-5' exonuclease [Weeksellaceae bacterium TAE3-ERU29]|nr:3'-5' exonuclease [Weeksellaceae bacterium TAE3-ERU29]
MKYAILDIEATGGKKGEEKIIDLAIYQFDGEEITDQFGSMINPERSIDQYVQKLTGITDKMVRRAPKFYELAKRVIEITQDCVIVGHGVVFDYRMLRQEFKSLGFDFERETLDTLELSQRLIPEEESYSLGKLCKSLGIPVNNRHRAQGDTLATLELFKLLLEKDSSKKIIQLYAQSDPNNKEHVNKLLRLQQGLPEKAGAYYYHTVNGKVFYLNATRNIAVEVNADFASDKVKKQHIQNVVARVTFETTGSYLVALLKAQHERKLHKNYIPVAGKDLFFKYGLFVKKEKETGKQSLEIEKVFINKKSPLLLFPTRNKAFKEKEALERFFNFDEKDSISERNSKINKFKKSLKFEHENFIILDKGRTPREKSFIMIKNERLISYGFFTYFNQFEDKSIREKISLNLNSTIYTKALIRTFIKNYKSIKIVPFDKEENIKIPRNERKR